MAQTPRARSVALLARGTPPGTPAGLAAVGMAAAHLDADRTGAAFPARARVGARVGAAAAGLGPGRGAAVLRLSSGARAVAEPLRAVQRVRRALVRGGLPAAVHLPHRMRGAAHVPAAGQRPDAAATRAAEPGAAAALDVV